jgi:hypothetical protein
VLHGCNRGRFRGEVLAEIQRNRADIRDSRGWLLWRAAGTGG